MKGSGQKGRPRLLNVNDIIYLKYKYPPKRKHKGTLPKNSQHDCLDAANWEANETTGAIVLLGWYTWHSYASCFFFLLA